MYSPVVNIDISLTDYPVLCVCLYDVFCTVSWIVTEIHRKHWRHREPCLTPWYHYVHFTTHTTPNPTLIHPTSTNHILKYLYTTMISHSNKINIFCGWIGYFIIFCKWIKRNCGPCIEVPIIFITEFKL